MRALNEPLRELGEYEQIIRSLQNRNTPVHIDGCIDSQKCHMISSLGEDYPYKLIVTYNEIKAKDIYEDYSFFDKRVCYYPPKDLIFFSADIHSNLITSRRLEALRRLMDGSPVTIITTIDGLLDFVMPFSRLCSWKMHYQVGDVMPFSVIAQKLVAMGFERTQQVEKPGEFAIRGGILDVYNIGEDCPYRVELWDDEVDTIKLFDAQTQRSIEQVDAITIYPATEYMLTPGQIERGMALIESDAKKQRKVLLEGISGSAENLARIVDELKDNLKYGFGAVNLESYMMYFQEELVSFLDYFDNDESIIFVDEPAHIAERGEYLERTAMESLKTRLEKGYILPKQMHIFDDYRHVAGKIAGQRTVLLSTLGYNSGLLQGRYRCGVSVNSMHSYRGDFELLVKELRRWKEKKYRLVVVCRSETRGRRLAEGLEENEVYAYFSKDLDTPLQPGEIRIIQGNLHHGIEYPMLKYAILSETDIFGEEKKKRRQQRRSTTDGERIRNFSQLSVGDYVIHENHGVGIYKGLEQVVLDNVSREYARIEYQDGAALFILATQMDLLQKFADKDAEHVKVNRLGGIEWKKTKTRVKKAVQEVARDLVALYAAREKKKGYACGGDTHWQREFEEMFPYEETRDQLDAVAAAKADMESDKIMDRLICGDVGFGKTEVAIRAAFKMVQESKQCAVLVPTTILAQQHYNTFVQRLKDYPVNIGLLCRFRTKKQQEETVKKLAQGNIDIVIGTHRLLSKDVAFKDLGLLVVDEEQRFGVTHKEKIKKYKNTVDVLTLTATPIPRTMHMSLIGIRDVSLLEEAPVDRQPIQTYVMEENEEMVREAIIRELERGGQVYYVYNRVKNIEDVSARIRRMVPGAEVAFAHGQMSERELENIMYSFVNGEIDVLVATTIIETGLDIPNVNTILIHNSDQMGLAQLYQLRGRVGRSGRVAYAFLLYERDKVLREVAEKRLSAIREFTELGSGYRIAMRDLEIRGAGSLLGESQSGHMQAVGYDLYCKLLGQAVAEAKGEEIQEDFDTTIDMLVDAFIPSTYIKNELQKLDMYKRIALIRNIEDYEEIMDEMIDRFGDIPKPAANLLMVALIKAKAHDCYVLQLVHRGVTTQIYMHPQAKIDVTVIPDLFREMEGRMKMDSNPKEPCFMVDMRSIPKTGLLAEENRIMDLMMKMLLHKEEGE